MHRYLCLTIMLLIPTALIGQNAIPLYPGVIPGSKPGADLERTEERNGHAIIHNVTQPTIAVFKPAKKNANGTAVVIFPGGGYRVNAIVHEGYDVAKKFNEFGVTAFVVKYRVPDDQRMTDKRYGPLQDAQQAIGFVRNNAAMYDIDPNRIGILGFSAGGHLASTAGTHFEKPVLSQDVSVRPDFMMLIYPVISMRMPLTHAGSRESLLGTTPVPEDVDYFSNELHVNEKTPPAFLVHAANDSSVKVDNSLNFYDALLARKVQAELHVYPLGGHGFGLVNPSTPDLWMEHCRHWLDSMGLLTKK
jgi:acetyl esterase/lipase